MPPTDPVHTAEVQAAVRRALADLPPAMGLAVGLRHLDGHDIPTIARLLGRSAGAVKVLISRGLARLRTPLAPHAPAVALAALAEADPGSAGASAAARLAAGPPTGRAVPYPSPTLTWSILRMSIPVLAAALAVIALWPAPVRAADPPPAAPQGWWTADPLGAIGDGATVALQLAVPPGRSLADGGESPYPPLERTLLARTRILTLVMQGDLGLAVFDGPGTGDPAVVAAITRRCAAAGWPAESATLAGAAGLRLGRGIQGSLDLRLTLGTSGSGAVLATRGRVGLRPELGWIPRDGRGEHPGVLVVAGGPDRLLLIPGTGAAAGPWLGSDGSVAVSATAAWMRRMLAADRASGAVVAAAGRIIGPPTAVALVADGRGIRLTGAALMADATQAVRLADTLRQAAAGADGLAGELAPYLPRLLRITQATPDKALVDAALGDIQRGIAETLSGIEAEAHGDEVRARTRIGGMDLEDLLDGLTGRL
jgi:hypothetical protein